MRETPYSRKAAERFREKHAEVAQENLKRNEEKNTVRNETRSHLSQAKESLQSPKLTYRIKPGETLSRIAARYTDKKNRPLRWEELYKENQHTIKNPKTIYPGQVIIIPQGYAPPTVPRPQVSLVEQVDHPTEKNIEFEPLPRNTNGEASEPWPQERANTLKTSINKQKEDLTDLQQRTNAFKKNLDQNEQDIRNSQERIKTLRARVAKLLASFKKEKQE